MLSISCYFYSLSVAEQLKGHILDILAIAITTA